MGNWWALSFAGEYLFFCMPVFCILALGKAYGLLGVQFLAPLLAAILRTLSASIIRL